MKHWASTVVVCVSLCGCITAQTKNELAASKRATAFAEQRVAELETQLAKAVKPEEATAIRAALDAAKAERDSARKHLADVQSAVTDARIQSGASIAERIASIAQVALAAFGVPVGGQILNAVFQAIGGAVTALRRKEGAAA